MIPLLAPLLALALAQDAQPQESQQKAPEPKDPASQTTEAIPTARVMPITLQQCIYMVEKNSLVLRLDELDVQIAKGQVGQSLGKFDTSYFFNLQYRKDKTPTTTAVQTGAGGAFTPVPTVIRVVPILSESWQINTGFSGMLVNGATWQADINYLKTEREQSAFDDFNPSYRTDIGVALTQPLLRGAGTTVAKASVLAAENTMRSEGESLEESRVQRAREVISAYWAYYFTRRQFETRKLLVTQSENLVAINKKKFEVGDMTELDVIEAQSELAKRQQELIAGQNDIERTADQLKRLIFAFEDRSEWDIELLPLTDAEEEVAATPDWHVAAAVAIERRPELKRRRELLKTNDLTILVAENDMLPQLDLNGSLRFNQLSATKDDALNYDDDLYSIAAGVSLTVPLGNRTARYGLSIARLQKVQALVDFKNAENTVIDEVRSGVREVINRAKEIEAAREAVRLATRRLNNESRRRDVGFSTTYLVREAQSSWREAIDAELQARFNYQVALAALDAAQGVLLESYGILPAPVPRLEDRAGLFYDS